MLELLTAIIREATDALASPRATSILSVPTTGNNANLGRNSWKERPLERSLSHYFNQRTNSKCNLSKNCSNLLSGLLSKHPRWDQQGLPKCMNEVSLQRNGAPRLAICEGHLGFYGKTFEPSPRNNIIFLPFFLLKIDKRIVEGRLHQ
ncbi:hypothetical protein AVEN_190208-1 [Araneus ventricosus]|uniref:Uncharacterized protein n=1 Tax=Araneus ventricosus TaxID=182803 RepID=A0A4Y2FCI1_ARAVE|nr:hypothetical protein AVEN_190208-1 [Araneus ventricosus]